MAEELFHRIMQMADNAGATDEHRACNYLRRALSGHLRHRRGRLRAKLLAHGGSRSGRPPLSGVRRIVEVIFSFTNRQTDVTEKSFTRVDVTEEFPFLVSKIAPYYDR